MTLRRSVFASLAGTYGVFAIQIATSMVLSRLMTPAEMGVWGVAQAAIFLSATLRDFGAGDYLIRSGEITPRGIGRVFAVMLCISLACAAALWFGRGAIAAFFHEPRLVGLIGIATLTYLLMPFGLGALVTMERELAFASLQMMSLIATLAGSATAILLAWRGFSFYSLAWAQFVQMALLLALRTAARPKAVFCLPVFSGWGRIFHFGFFTTCTALVGQISAQSVTAIFGRLLGFAPLGLYDRAQSMSSYVSSGLTFPVMQVVYVAIARAKDKPAELGALFLTTLENLTGALWPAYALMALLAEPMFYLLYGPNWVAAAPLFRLICLAAMAITLCIVNARVLTALGRVQSIFSIEVVMMCLRLAAALLLAPYGIWYAVLGVVFPSFLAVPFYWRAVWPYAVMPRRELMTVCWHSVAVTLATLAMPVLLMTTPVLGHAPPMVQFPVCAAAGGVGWLLGIWLCGHRLRAELEKVWQHGISLFQERLRLPPVRPMADIPAAPPE